MSTFNIDITELWFFFLICYVLVPKIKICLEYFLDKKYQKAVIVYCYIPSDSLKPRQTAGNEAQSAVSTDYFTQYYIVLRVSWGQVDGSSWRLKEEKNQSNRALFRDG